MKISLLFLIAGCIFYACAQTDSEWESFKETYSKSYVSSTHESQRRRIWEENYKKIRTHNSGRTSYNLGHSTFMDRTEAEITKLLSARIPKTKLKRPFLVRLTNESTEIQVKPGRPDKADYRNDPCSSTVKDQGKCGSSWAFSATYLAEFYNCKKTGQAVQLSEQQLLDCDLYNNGCKVGFYDRAWTYIIESAGICSSSSYSYTSTSGSCRSSSCKTSASLKSVKYIPNDTESIMEVIANIGPVSAAMDAKALVFYSSGVYADSSCSGEINHAVNIVGYGTAVDGTPYWIVRNSWGVSWGFKGYALVKRGVNMCGIESHVAYPTV